MPLLQDLLHILVHGLAFSLGRKEVVVWRPQMHEAVLGLLADLLSEKLAHSWINWPMAEQQLRAAKKSWLVGLTASAGVDD